MFKITEFATIASVSRRLLQHYDDIGLFKPTYTNTETGYRYYSAEQLPRLNRILALKDLGFSLEQVARMVQIELSPAEIRGMLALKKAQIEQTVYDEMMRLRQVELRLQQIEEEGNWSAYDVILKSVPSQHFFSIRREFESSASFVTFFYDVYRAVPSDVRKHVGHYAAIAHKGGYDPDPIDMEIGFLMDSTSDSFALVTTQGQLALRELEGVARMATLVIIGTVGPVAYNALGTWIEANGYEFAGPDREVFLKLQWPPIPEQNVIEIQIPVRKGDAYLLES